MHLQLLAAFFTLAIIRFFLKKAKEVSLIGKIPGPSGFPFVGQSFQFKNSGDRLQKLLKWSEDFGPRFKIQFGLKSHIVLANAEDVQAILTTHTDVDKGKDYEYYWPWIGITVLTSAGKKWENKRSMMDPAFHSKAIDSNNYLEIINKRSEALVQILLRKTNEPITVNINSENEILTLILKILMEITTGQTTPGLKRKDYGTASFRLKKQIDHRQYRPWLYSNILWRLSPSGREESRCLKVIQDIVDDIIKKKKDERRKDEKAQRKKKKHDDFMPPIKDKKSRRGVLDHLLDWQEKAKAPNTLSDDDIRDEINSLIFAGHEPTASCITWALYLLGSNVAAQEKVREELDEILDAKKDTHFINLKDLDRMSYLEMCIQETLRLHPSVPTIGRDVYADFKLDDQTVLPAGVSVTLLVHKMHRNPQTFPQPNQFRPERFSTQNSKLIDSGYYLPFSQGKRGCLGQNLAMIITKMVLVKLLMRFSVAATAQTEDSDEIDTLLTPFSNDPKMIELIPRE